MGCAFAIAADGGEELFVGSEGGVQGQLTVFDVDGAVLRLHCAG